MFNGLGQFLHSILNAAANFHVGAVPAPHPVNRNLTTGGQAMPADIQQQMQPRPVPQYNVPSLPFPARAAPHPVSPMPVFQYHQNAQPLQVFHPQFGMITLAHPQVNPYNLQGGVTSPQGSYQSPQDSYFQPQQTQVGNQGSYLNRLYRNIGGFGE